MNEEQITQLYKQFASQFPDKDSLLSEDVIKFILTSAKRIVDALSLKSVFEEPKFNFGSGHLDYDVLHDIPRYALETMREINDSPSLFFKENIQLILSDELGIRAPTDKIKTYLQSARFTIDHVLSHVAGGDGKIALPVPNWNFWRNTRQFNRENFSFFNALTEDQLVTNFEEIAKKNQ